MWLIDAIYGDIYERQQSVHKINKQTHTHGTTKGLQRNGMGKFCAKIAGVLHGRRKKPPNRRDAVRVMRRSRCCRRNRHWTAVEVQTVKTIRIYKHRPFQLVAMTRIYRIYGNDVCVCTAVCTGLVFNAISIHGPTYDFVSRGAQFFRIVYLNVRCLAVYCPIAKSQWLRDFR